MLTEQEVEKKLKFMGAEFHYFVDVSNLPEEQNKCLPNVILFGISLTPAFVQEVISTPDYVQDLKTENRLTEDEFNQKEIKVNNMADQLASFLIGKGYNAYSQSEENIDLTGFYDKRNNITPLPHKTIARLAGLGWIGKNDLLVNPELGCAFCMCSVLTDAPLKTIFHDPLNSKCGECNVCKNVCPVDAISGNNWEDSKLRDNLVDVHKCITCLKCMVFCPFSKAYMNSKK